MKIKEALQTILDLNFDTDTEEYGWYHYTKTYIDALKQSYKRYGDHGVAVQILYILSSIVDVDTEYETLWTGNIADEVIKTLKNYKEGSYIPE